MSSRRSVAHIAMIRSFSRPAFTSTARTIMAEIVAKRLASGFFDTRPRYSRLRR
jgi:hypothetical protein